MVYLIGVDHLVQYRGPLPESNREEFLSYILDCCCAYRVRTIAEEFSEEALREVYLSDADTAVEAAMILGIEHRFCDPEEEDLRRLGIPYFAEIRDEVMKRRGITTSFILDNELRRSVRMETEQIVRSFWPIREQYWYERIRDALTHPLLFICGHEHVEGFSRLLESRGHGCIILSEWWRSELFSNYELIGL